MRILITGTAGFIGFSLARHLIAEGHEVIGIDNLNDYYSPVYKKERHLILDKSPHFTPCIIDVADRDALASVFDKHKPELVCHLAAQAGVRYSMINPGAYIHSNLDAFYAIIDETLKGRIERFVYASSSSVYGGNTKIPFSEKDRVDNPISLYAATKRSNELMAHAYSHIHGLQTVGLRFFTVYGPWGRPDMATWQFPQRMMRGEPIKVYNEGNMRRDFTFIDDIVDGAAAALFSKNLETYEIINLGNNKPVELMHLIHLYEEGLGIKAEMNMQETPRGDVLVTYADIEYAREKLGFDPKTSIEDGVALYLEWIKENEALFMETTAKAV